MIVVEYSWHPSTTDYDWRGGEGRREREGKGDGGGRERERGRKREGKGDGGGREGMTHGQTQLHVYTLYVVRASFR